MSSELDFACQGGNFHNPGYAQSSLADTDLPGSLDSYNSKSAVLAPYTISFNIDGTMIATRPALSHLIYVPRFTDKQGFELSMARTLAITGKETDIVCGFTSARDGTSRESNPNNLPEPTASDKRFRPVIGFLKTDEKQPGPKTATISLLRSDGDTDSENSLTCSTFFIKASNPPGLLKEAVSRDPGDPLTKFINNDEGAKCWKIECMNTSRTAYLGEQRKGFEVKSVDDQEADNTYIFFGPEIGTTEEATTEEGTKRWCIVLKEKEPKEIVW